MQNCSVRGMKMALPWDKALNKVKDSSALMVKTDGEI